jgi:hypothetical protein
MPSNRGDGNYRARVALRAKELMHRDKAFLQPTSGDFDARCRKVDLWLVFVGRVCPEDSWVVNKGSLSKLTPAYYFTSITWNGTRPSSSRENAY